MTPDPTPQPARRPEEQNRPAPPQRTLASYERPDVRVTIARLRDL